MSSTFRPFRGPGSPLTQVYCQGKQSPFLPNNLRNNSQVWRFDSPKNRVLTEAQGELVSMIEIDPAKLLERIAEAHTHLGMRDALALLCTLSEITEREIEQNRFSRLASQFQFRFWILLRFFTRQNRYFS
jgi:hypothetical protein